MSTRPKRVPRDGLFWFEIDNTLEIRPTKTVICEKDQIQIENFVSFMYGQHPYAKALMGQTHFLAKVF